MFWPLIDLKDNLYDQLLKRVTSDNDHWMTWIYDLYDLYDLTFMTS